MKLIFASKQEAKNHLRRIYGELKKMPFTTGDMARELIYFLSKLGMYFMSHLFTKDYFQKN